MAPEAESANSFSHADAARHLRKISFYRPWISNLKRYFLKLTQNSLKMAAHGRHRYAQAYLLLLILITFQTHYVIWIFKVLSHFLPTIFWLQSKAEPVVLKQQHLL
jgi:hypothetical protein